MTRQQFKDFIKVSNWTFAKTMPDNPHEYTLRKDADLDFFNQAVIFIREYGYKIRFGQTWYKCYNIGGYRYWTMGAPLPSTILINRAAIKTESLYDQLAPQYDLLFNEVQYRLEDNELFGMIGPLTGSVLDLGAGTGHVLDNMKIDEYTGLEPSQMMVQQFLYKHPKREMWCCELQDLPPGRWDNIIAMFSASYVIPTVQIMERWNGNGSLFLVFYKTGYTPRTHQIGSGSVDYTHYSPGDPLLQHIFGVSAFEFHNYVIVKKTGNDN